MKQKEFYLRFPFRKVKVAILLGFKLKYIGAILSDKYNSEILQLPP